MNAQAIIVIVILAAVGFAIYWFAIRKRGGSSGSPTTSGSVGSSGWWIINSKPNDGPLKQFSDGTYFFYFPSSPTGIHYVMKQAPSLQMGQAVKLEFNLSGAGTVVPAQGDKASVSLILQRKDDNLSGTGPYQQYRYFHMSAPLINGDGSLCATLTPDQWSDVWGKSGMEFQTQFADCVANAAYIGFGCGDPGAGATGHGAYATNGDVRFTIKSFEVV